jgi:Secretion system C-terminal sorting domain
MRLKIFLTIVTVLFSIVLVKPQSLYDFESGATIIGNTVEQYNNGVDLTVSSSTGFYIHNNPTTYMIGNYIVMNGGATSATFTFSRAVVVKSINLEGLFTSFGTTDSLTFTCYNGKPNNLPIAIFSEEIDGYNGQTFNFPSLPTGIFSFTITRTGGGTFNYGFDNISVTKNIVNYENGVLYNPPSINPNTQNNPIGRFKLSTLYAATNLYRVGITLEGSFTGVDTVKLWRSFNSTFSEATATLLDTDDNLIDPGFIMYPYPTISGSNNYFFITIDAGSSPTGTIRAFLSQLILYGGNIDDAINFSDPNSTAKYLSFLPAALPVELTSFTAGVAGNKVNLNWQTATEVNNYGFEIERNQSISQSEDNWIKIGFVEGNGTSNSPKKYSYADNSSLTSGKYYYRLKQIDNDGSFKYSKTAEVSITQPEKFALEQNYPNPFNPETTIKYALPYNSFVTLKVYDVLGAEIASLVNEEQTGGEHTITFKANNLSSGIYFYSLITANYKETKKMLLTK